jgi:tetratricopeptide (TPR) repeat protein
MKSKLWMFVLSSSVFVLAAAVVDAQTQVSEIDPTRWGVVLDSPAMKNVTVKKDITYLKDEKSTLAVDIYLPADAKAAEKRPAVIFLNAIGDRPGSKLKNWGIYSSWPRLMAAHGMIGISMDADADRIQGSLAGLFAFLEREGTSHGIDPTRLGIYAASANTTQSLVYLMGDRVSKGIRAAALYYGASPAPDTTIRKDLPVLYILAEGDLQGGFGRQSLNLWQRVTDARAPWTMMFARGMIHAFDAFQDDDDSRRIVMQTIAFWKTHLEPVPQPSWERSAAREIVASTYGNDAQKSVDLLTKYILDNPKDAQAYVYRARALGTLGNTDGAAADYGRAIELDPNNMFSVGGFGQARFSQRRYAEAETLLSKAASMGFRNSLIYGQLAYSQLALNKNAEAIKNYENAFEMGIPPGANTSGLAYFNMACGYARMKQADKAFEMLNKAINDGYTTRESYENDDDLAPLRGDARFAELLSRLPKASN